MTLSTWLYLTGLLSNIDMINSILVTLSCFAFFILIIFYFVLYVNEDDSGKNKFKEFVKLLSKKWYLFILYIIFACAIPSEKTMYLILGSNYLTSSDVPAKVSKILNLKLDELLADTNKDSSSTSSSKKYIRFARNGND